MAFGRVRSGYREVRHQLKMRKTRREQAANPGVYAIRYQTDTIGFFAQLTWCLEIFFHCDESGLVPYLELTGPSYGDPARGSNWLEYYFMQRRVTAEIRAAVEQGRITVTCARTPDDLGVPRNYNDLLSFEKGNALFEKYLALRPAVLERVEAFHREHLAGRKVLGLHYRASDKAHEAQPLGRLQLRELLRAWLEEHPGFDCIYLASDEEDCDEYLRKSFPGLLVVHPEGEEKAAGTQAVHYKGSGDPYQIGLEALMNSLLLARCDALLKTASFLSGWSKIFNPALQCHLLNSPLGGCNWFPDRGLSRWRPARGNSRLVGEPSR